MVRIHWFTPQDKKMMVNFILMYYWVQGGIEMIKSKRDWTIFMLQQKRASVTCTFDEETCKSIVGTEDVR